MLSVVQRETTLFSPCSDQDVHSVFGSIRQALQQPTGHTHPAIPRIPSIFSKGISSLDVVGDAKDITRSPK